jgi:esterase/lipase
VESEERLQKEADDKVERKQRKEARSVELAMWKTAEKERKARNEVKRHTYQESVNAWEEECNQAKLEDRRPRWAKPKLEPLESPIVVVEEFEDEDVNANASESGESDLETDLN